MLQTSQLFLPPPQPVDSSPHPSNYKLPQSLSTPPHPKLSPLSRRSLTLHGSSSILLLLALQQAIDPLKLPNAKAEEVGEDGTRSPCSDKTPTKRAFIDISIDGQSQGRVVIGLYENDVPTGVARFSKLISGTAGVSYRRKEFTKIMPNYIQHGGVRSYGVDAEMLQRRGGGSLGSETLSEEWERQSMTSCSGGTKMSAGSVGIVVRNANKAPPKMKLVARKGKLEIDEEEVGSDPNGSEFVIAFKDSPELDSSVLVIGKVLEGMDVVEKVEKVKTVQENTSSPYFRVAKLIGDKRAVVAERGFNRPYSKVVVTNCSLIQ